MQLVEQQLRIVRKPLAVDCLLDHDYFLNYLLRMLFDNYGISHIMGHVIWAILYDSYDINQMIWHKYYERHKIKPWTHHQSFDSSFAKKDFEDIDGLVSYHVLNMNGKNLLKWNLKGKVDRDNLSHVIIYALKDLKLRYDE